LYLEKRNKYGRSQSSWFAHSSNRGKENRLPPPPIGLQSVPLDSAQGPFGEERERNGRRYKL
ncbi:unnamed protein product, partial [Nesidiocoris tenuis]